MRKAGGGCRQGRAAFAGAMSEAGGRPTRTGARVPREISLSGLLAVGFGFAGIFSFGPVFVPLALLFSLAAFLRRRPAWGAADLVLTIIGLFSSPLLLSILGLGWLIVRFV